MQVTVGENSYVGIGPNKKIAKRNAAEGLLIVLGYSSGGSANSRLAPVDINRKVIKFGFNFLITLIDRNLPDKSLVWHI